ncbi:MAG: LysR family transcriptional regulator [Pseudomonadota bacterium]
MANWDDIRVFLEVARSGGLSAAKDRLRLDAATVGRRIARLERAQGTVLFQRSPQGYTLTQAGQALLDHVEAAEAHLNSGLAALPQRDGVLSGPVRIGAPDGCANFLLPQVCAQITESHPGLTFQIIALPRLFNLTRREADMAIGVSLPTARRLLVQKISDYQLHLAATQTIATTAVVQTSIADHPSVGYIGDMIFDRELDYADHFSLGAPRLSSNSISVQMNMLAAGAGIGVVHQFAMPFFPTLRPIIGTPTLTRSFYMIRAAEDKKNQRLTTVAQLVLQNLRTEIARLERVVQST